MEQKFYHSAADIRERLHLTDEEAADIDRICEQYPMRTSAYYLSLIDPDDPDDPIRKLSIPSPWETGDGGHEDTSGEGENTVLPGMQHKYGQTALILSTSECYMYCRHCFRKRMVGLTDSEIASHLGDMAEYLRAHPEISNILVSGGDAFFNSNARLRQYLEAFTPLPQLDFIRFGTRVPVVLPERVYGDEDLLDLLGEYNERKQLYIVTQFNHPREVTPEACCAVKALLERGLVVKNQTVLLRGINDDPAVLGELLRKLTACGVVPYYIFQCRPVRGVLNHFQIPLEEGARIVDAARAMQNGQGKCVRYVMSHHTGKIEILGQLGEEMLFKYHQAKYHFDANRIFTQKLASEQAWL